VELYFHSSNTPSWRGAELKHRDITHAFGEVSLNMPRINKSEAEYDKYKDGIRVVLTS
jgi:hypothetical protein